MADEKIIFSMVGVSKTFTNQKRVLNNIYLSFFYGAKIGIIGLNGSGKSTLMKIIAGIDKNFEGEVVFSPGYTVGYLEQEPKLDDAKTVKEVVEEGCAETVALLKEYEEINMKLCEGADVGRRDGAAHRASGRTLREDRPLQRLGTGQRARAGDGRPAMPRSRPAGQGALGR